MERVDGVVVAADALGHTFGVRVLKMDRPQGPEGFGIALSGDEYKDLSSPLRPAPFLWDTKEGSLMGRICARTSPTWQFYAELPTKEGACVTGSAIVS